MKNNNEKLKTCTENRANEGFLQKEIHVELGVYHDSGSDIIALFIKTKTRGWNDYINSEWKTNMWQKTLVTKLRWDRMAFDTLVPLYGTIFLDP